MRCRQRGGGRRAQHNTVEELELERCVEERVRARAGSRHDDLGTAQAQIERIEQCRMADEIFARGSRCRRTAGRLFVPLIIAGQHG